jgi:hypothetical protein
MAVAAPSVAQSSSTTVSGTIPLTICQVAASGTDYANQVESDDLVSIRNLSLSGLSSGISYHYAVKSVHPDNGNPLTAVQADFVFITVTAGTVLTIVSPPNGKSSGGGEAGAWPKLKSLAASGGMPHYTWCIARGSRSCGPSLNASTGVIFGTPTKAGMFKFTVQVTDTVGATVLGLFPSVRA